MKSRRQFIRQGVLASVGPALVTACRRFGFTPKTELDATVVKKFGAKLKGRLILPNDLEYDTARRVNYWNPRTEKRPAMIAQCASPDDVARGIEFARRHHLPAAVRSGGHSFLGWSTCDDGLVV